MLLAAPNGFTFSELCRLVPGNKFTVRSALNKGKQRGEFELRPDGKYIALEAAEAPRRPGRPSGQKKTPGTAVEGGAGG